MKNGNLFQYIYQNVFYFSPKSFADAEILVVSTVEALFAPIFTLISRLRVAEFKFEKVSQLHWRTLQLAGVPKLALLTLVG